MEVPNRDRKVAQVFEYVGSYIVGVYVNSIYESARQNGTRAPSITDEYRLRVRTYVTAVKTDKSSYHSTIQDLHNYLRTYVSRFQALSFAGFVDLVVSKIVPEDHFSHMRSTDKDEILGTVLCDLIAGLGTYCTSSEVLPLIIDRRDQIPTTIERLQDYAQTTLFTLRDDIHNRFLHKEGQAKDTIPRSSVDGYVAATLKMTDKYKEAKARASKLAKRVNELAERVDELEGELDEKNKRVEKYKRITKELHGRAEQAEAALEASQRRSRSTVEPRRLPEPQEETVERRRRDDDSRRRHRHQERERPRERSREPEPEPDRSKGRVGSSFFRTKVDSDFFARPGGGSEEPAPAPIFGLGGSVRDRSEAAGEEPDGGQGIRFQRLDDDDE